MSEKLPKHAGRILELDALRGLAAVAVVLFHFTTRYDALFEHTEPLALNVPWGHYGVDLFFMLSGFVILMTLDRQSRPLQFAWGRFSRLYPAYWAAVVATFAVVSWCGLPGQEVSWGAAMVNLTMVQALFDAPHVDGAYWSLQAELIFYANMLALYLLGAFRRPRTTVALWLGIAVGVHAGGLLCGQMDLPGAASFLTRLATITSLKFIPLFAVGMLFYQARDRGVLTWQDGVCLFASWAIAGFLEGGVVHASVAALLSGVLWLAVTGHLPLLTGRFFVWLGALSYPLYLIHQNIGFVLMRWLEAHGISPEAAVAAAIGFTLLLAIGLHGWVEQPALNLLRKRKFAASLSRQSSLNPI